MLHKPTETSASHWNNSFSGSTTSSSQSLHPSIPKCIRLASSPSHPYYQAYAPFPGPTPYQGYPTAGPGFPHNYPAAIGPSPGVYTSGGYPHGVPQAPQSHNSSNGETFYLRKRAPSDSDHHALYQRSRNPSSTSIGHVSIHDRSSFHLESDRPKTQTREASTIPRHHPKANALSSSSSNSSRNVAYQITGLRIASLLSGRTTDCPFIDWHVWDKMYSSSARDASGQFCATDMELEAFDPPVREPIFIKAIPGKSDGFSIAVQRWGPIRVSPRRPGSPITVNDIMLAISLWMMVPIQPEDWKIFDKIFEKHVTDAFESRKMYAKTHRPLTGSAKDRAQVVDSLFCRVRWDGMVISDDFAESKAVYLRLKDSSLRV